MDIWLKTRFLVLVVRSKYQMRSKSKMGPPDWPKIRWAKTVGFSTYALYLQHAAVAKKWYPLKLL